MEYTRRESYLNLAQWNMRVLCFALMLCGLKASAQEAPEPIKNLDLLQILAKRIAIQVSSNVTLGNTVFVRVNPKDASWYIESGLYDGFRSERVATADADSATYIAVFSIRDSRIRYEKPRGDNIFGERCVDRRVILSLNVKLERRFEETPVLVQQFDEEFTDTISVAKIDQIENPIVDASKGTLESGGFFSTFLEPIVLLGSIGVAVFLLFHVRS